MMAILRGAGMPTRFFLMSLGAVRWMLFLIGLDRGLGYVVNI
jgi:hypothetical protein